MNLLAPPPVSSPAALGAAVSPAEDSPQRPAWLTRDVLLEAAVPVVSAFSLVAVIFLMAGVWAPLGFTVCWLASFAVIYWFVVRRRHGVLVAKDRLATLYVWSGAVVALIPLAAIIVYVLWRGFPVVFTHFPHFLVGDMSQARPSDRTTAAAGMGAAILGTIEQVALATVITVPVAILAATFLNESRSGFARIVRGVVDAMTGTPSIIAGLFVYLFWVVPRHTAGSSGFAASLALSVLMLPFVTRTAEEVLKVVPGTLREAAVALGSPHWRMVMRVILPTARTGLVTAVILGIARAVGETAPVLFTTQYTTRFNLNPFHGPQSDLPLQVYTLIVSPSTVGIKEGWGGALVLVAVVLTLFVLARLLGSDDVLRRVVAWRKRPSEIVG
ncbi:MAG: phosphate ABC transporter permease PstA [Acidimicrobiales bacterium]